MKSQRVEYELKLYTRQGVLNSTYPQLYEKYCWFKEYKYYRFTHSKSSWGACHTLPLLEKKKKRKENFL